MWSTPPLTRHRLADTDVPDLARAALLASLDAVEVQRPYGRFHLHVQQAALGPDAGLTWLHSTGRWMVRTAPRRSRLRIWVHDDGSVEHLCEGLAVRSSSALAVVQRHDLALTLRLEPLSALVLDVDPHRAARTLGELAWARMTRRRLPVFDPRRGPGRALSELLLHLAAQRDRAATALPADSPALGPLVDAALVLLAEALGSHAEAPEKAPSEERVERAEALLRQHLAAGLSVNELAVRLGVTPRTVQDDFRRHRERTPGEALRDLRLQRVHDVLVNATGTTTVTDTALAAGFSHMGRFSGWYKAAYGESPSETLARAQRPERLLR